MTLTADWIVGFVDRSASFFILLEPGKKYRSGSRLRPEFRIIQPGTERKLLNDLRLFFGFGTIRVNSAGQLEYRVRNMSELERLMEFFDSHPLQSTKAQDVRRFREILLELRTEDVHEHGVSKAQMLKLERMALPFLNSSKRRIRKADR